jgi:hypothetical protein
MAADAETHRTEFGTSDTRMLREVIERRAPVFVEMGDWCLGGVLQPASSSAVIEGNYNAQWLYAVIDFGRGGDEPVPGQPNARPQHRSRELKNIGITKYSWIRTGRLRRRHEHTHGRPARGDVNVLGRYDHVVK